MVLLLLIMLPVQVFVNGRYVPGFVKHSDARISKTILTYEKSGSEFEQTSRTMQYRLQPYLWNRFLLLTSISFASGEKLNTQFLITFWPQKMYSIKHISPLGEAEESKYFDVSEQHVLWEGGDETFQVLLENPDSYCYIQLSSQAVQCVDVHRMRNVAG
ncbi:hypothetical protein P2G85_03725 [Vibrio sp. CAU 1672]|nr:hypothetical protein [Vibrio sp. CAU 1672]